MTQHSSQQFFRPLAELRSNEASKYARSEFKANLNKRPGSNQKSRGFKDLMVWQQAVQMAIAIYALTATFPESERFGLSSQMRRAAVSVPSNIAEGYGRLTTGEFKQFLGHARGSNSELETQLTISTALGYGTSDTRAKAETLIASVSRLLRAYMNSLEREDV